MTSIAYEITTTTGELYRLAANQHSGLALQTLYQIGPAAAIGFRVGASGEIIWPSGSKRKTVTVERIVQRGEGRFEDVQELQELVLPVGEGAMAGDSVVSATACQESRLTGDVIRYSPGSSAALLSLSTSSA